MRCASCGTENAAGRKFCLQCGTPLASACPQCGSPNEPQALFCGECGAPLKAEGAIAATRLPAPPAAPAAERRLVSILFVDLVGFTAASEQRDAEQVRELLTRYFEIGRRLVELYGGTLEKFIGDALMAVWGTPVANEDDAERAVRSALDILDAVEQLGDESGLPELRARAAVMTGEAAVTLGAVGQGMVAGDLVNTASRVQSLAEPGTVLVSDVTKRSSDAGIAYEDGGAHEVKGKEEPVHVWRALRVVATRGGSQRSTSLEPPFTGRERELRLLKELFHASAEEHKAHVVSITGIAGIGKSRLGWELTKYLDGLAILVRYAAGRCLAYGDGVTYWALAEMVRRRADIVEGDAPEVARAKLVKHLAELFPNEDERRWIESRLLVLLGLGEATGSDRQDLFGAWRRFFERLAEDAPTVLLFEDMQWADPALLEFIDHLLDWSRAHPIFVLSLGRPSAAERGLAGGRNLTQLHLEPLPEPAIRQLVSELVPGLPDDVLRRIVERSEGVPLYAVETIRMLLDRGALLQEGSAYRLAGPLGELQVPESLQGLIAARLDGLTADERRLVQDAAVMGKTFTAQGAAYVAGKPLPDVDGLLTSLVRKDVLAVQADPRSPERGQFEFVQDLVREVAYETLGRHDRRDRHLRVAAFIEQSLQPDLEVAEVLASHYEQAYRAAPDAADAAGIRGRACEMLERAGERAASLGAPEQAQSYFEQALPLTDDPETQARLHDRAGRQAYLSSLPDVATEHYELAIQLYEGLGRRGDAAIVSSRLSTVAFTTGRFADAIERLEEALAVLAAGEPGPELAVVQTQLARLLVLNGRYDDALPHIEASLTLAEELGLPEVFAEALNNRGVLLLYLVRPRESETLLRKALELSETYDFPTLMRSMANLDVALAAQDRYQEELELSERFLANARRMGDRIAEASAHAGRIGTLFLLGDWDQALAHADRCKELIDDAGKTEWGAAEVTYACWVHVNRGDLDLARGLIDAHASVEQSDNPEIKEAYWMHKGLVLSAEGRHAEALATAERVLTTKTGGTGPWLKFNVEQAVSAALNAGDLAKADAFMDRLRQLRPGMQTPFTKATLDRFEARIAAARGLDADIEARFGAAAALFLETGLPFHQAATRLEHAEWLVEQDRGDEARELAAEAEEIFRRLKARPWLQRAERITAGRAVRSRAEA